MYTKFTPEQLEGAKACKSIAELITFAKENGIELTEAEATELLAKLDAGNSEQLADGELDEISGGIISSYRGKDRRIKKDSGDKIPRIEIINNR